MNRSDIAVSSFVTESSPDEGIRAITEEGFELIEAFFFAAGEALSHLPDPPPTERFDDLEQYAYAA